MTVKELVDALNSLPQEHMVVIRGYDGGVDEIANIENVKIDLGINKEWYYGSHELIDARDATDDDFAAIYLSCDNGTAV
jgi:hypothetical protein